MAQSVKPNSSFAAPLPPLSPDEPAALKGSIQKDEVRDSVVVGVEASRNEKEVMMDEIDALPLYIPVTDIQEWRGTPEVSILCDECCVEIHDEAAYVDKGIYCRACIDLLIEDAKQDAVEFAVQDCAVHVERLPKFCPDHGYGPLELTGFIAYRNEVRHRYSNYDDLIHGLLKSSFWDYIRYSAIRNKIHAMLNACPVIQRAIELDEGYCPLDWGD